MPPENLRDARGPVDFRDIGPCPVLATSGPATRLPGRRDTVRTISDMLEMPVGILVA
jgi:hypothetical protein